MAASVQDALVETAPALSRPSRGLRRLIAELDSLADGEEVMAAAAGEDATGGWPSAGALAVTRSRLLRAVDRAAPSAIPLSDLTAVEVNTPEITIRYLTDSYFVFRGPHTATIAEALGEAGVHRESTGPESWVRAVRLDQPLNELLDACVILGGSGPYPLRFGADVKLRFNDGALSILTAEGVALEPIAYEDIVELDLGGAGRVTTNAGVVGGGFGLDGALTGMAIAAVLNAVTTQTTVEAILHLVLPDGEIFITNGRYTPEQLRLMLSEVFVRMRLKEPETANQ